MPTFTKSIKNHSQTKTDPKVGSFLVGVAGLYNSHIRYRSMGPFRLRLEPVVALRLSRWFSSQPAQTTKKPTQRSVLFWWEWLDCIIPIFAIALWAPFACGSNQSSLCDFPAGSLLSLPKPQKNRPKGRFFSGGSGWIRTSSGLSQQIYSLPRLSNSGARPILGAGSGNRTRISSLEGLHTSLCTMPATNSKLYDYILLQIKIK